MFNVSINLCSVMLCSVVVDDDRCVMSQYYLTLLNLYI